jgi:shikimate kinase / 3-dehydroquinate synthase
VAEITGSADGSRRALVFIGFMGAGKSVAARTASEALGEPSADADEVFLERHGRLPGELIAERGEAAFRAAEEELALELLERGPRVLALGGGAVEIPRVREALGEHVVVWCRVGLDEAWRRSRQDAPAHRPLAADREVFRRRFERRAPVYENLARAVLPEGDRGLAGRAAPWLAGLRHNPDVRLAWARSASGEYPAAVGTGAPALLHGPGIVERLGLSRWFAIADADVLSLHSGLLPACEAVIEVAAAEERKTLAEAERVLRELAGAGARRDDGVIGFGGGVVGDLAGFCAATYQRGIQIVHVPTTVVAQVDSAYGGKTGVDLPEAKNYVGAYHLPAAVLADPRVLSTLPEAELAAGFVEILKTALIVGGSLWERVTRLEDLDPQGLSEVIFASARAKIEIVAADERDRGGRAVLNLGHTVGHAIEAASGYTGYRHGEAVGLGLLATLRLSDADELRGRVEGILRRHGLPTALDAAIGTDEILAAAELDKKRTANGLGFVLVERPGEPRTGERVDSSRVRAAIDELRR